MQDADRADVERQIIHLLEEAELPMRVEEIIPHLDAVTPHDPNDVADVLQDLAQQKLLSREGSFFSRSTPVPIESLFHDETHREAARVVIGLIRELDTEEGEGARSPIVLKRAKELGLSADDVLDVVAILRNAGEAYSIGGDKLRLAKP